MESHPGSELKNDFNPAKLRVIRSILKRTGSPDSSQTEIFDDSFDYEARFRTDMGVDEDENLYPNSDSSVWLRSCEQEVIEPIHGTITGHIPEWLKGSLLRNGPGSLKVGEDRFNHLFDGSALLHRYEISDGKVTYQRRFVQTEVFKKNHAENKIVVTEFGTKATADPCRSIFQRISAVFNPSEHLSDNSMISIYPLGDEFYTFTENPIIHRIDPKTLETTGKVNISKHVAIVSHSAHPHIMEDGTIYNLGMSISACGPFYIIVSFTPNKIIKDEFGNEKKVCAFNEAVVHAKLKSRWILYPSYMHSFGMTENYFIIVEQPLSVAVVKMAKCQMNNEPISTSLKWHKNENTHIHVISRKNGRLVKTFISEAFFYMHIINQYESSDKDYITLDICSYRNAAVLDCMYVDAIENMPHNPKYANLFRGRPFRFVLPMKKPNTKTPVEENLIELGGLSESLDENSELDETPGEICQTNESPHQRKASAHRLSNGNIFVIPELLCNLGLETPCVNYDYYSGKEYQYFYGLSSDVDLIYPAMIIKVNIVNKTRRTWYEKDVYPSEPIFVPSPNAKSEDDGVILSALVWGRERETEVALLILDASTFLEIGRAKFVTPGPVPKCLHGWFSKNV